MICSFPIRPPFFTLTWQASVSVVTHSPHYPPFFCSSDRILCPPFYLPLARTIPLHALSFLPSLPFLLINNWGSALCSWELRWTKEPDTLLQCFINHPSATKNKLIFKENKNLCHCSRLVCKINEILVIAGFTFCNYVECRWYRCLVSDRGGSLKKWVVSNYKQKAAGDGWMELIWCINVPWFTVLLWQSLRNEKKQNKKLGLWKRNTQAQMLV